MAAENFKVKKGLEVGTAITATSSGVNVTGIVTATQFVGDGSGLTGVTGSGSGVVIKHDGSAIGTASTINFSTNLDVSAISAGIVTITASNSGLSNVIEDTTPQLGGNLDLDGKFINGTGGANITGVVTATTGDFVDIDVDGQTELDDLNVAGVSTFGNNITASGTSRFEIASMENGLLDGSIDHTGDTTTKIQFETSTIKLDTAGTTRLNINNSGAIVTGISTFSSNIDANGNLDVDGQTDLDDVVIAGVSTFNDGITLGTNSSTFAAKFIDNAVANFGTDNDLQVSHDNSNALIRNSTGKIVVVGVVSATSGAVVTGVVTATTFSGSGASLTNLPSGQLSGALPALDGSALTGVTASGSGIVVKHDGTTVGTAGTVNFSTNLDVTAVSAGIVTITASGGGATDKIEEGNSSVEVVDSGTGYVSVVTDNYERARFSGSGLNQGKIFVGDTTGVNNTYGSNAGHVVIVRSNASEPATLRLFGYGPGASDGTINNRIDFASHQSGSGGQTFAKIESVIRGSSDNSSDLTFHTALSATVSEKLRILANGNIGIGTDNPTSKLHVNGGAKVVGVMTATTFSGSGASLTSLDAGNLGVGTIANGRFPAILPAVSGANLTSLTAGNISGTLATGQIADEAVTFAKMQHVGTGVFIGRDSGGTGDIETMTAAEARTLLNVADGATAGITTASTNVVVTWDVVNNSGSSYRFTGPGNDGVEDNPDIYLVRGQKYRFAVNASSHPFYIKTAAGTGTGNQYTDGVTGNGAQSGNVEFNVQHDAPASLFYQCSAHGAMVGNIYIVGQHLANGVDNRVVTATSAYGMNGEANLRFDGSLLTVAGKITCDVNSDIDMDNSANGQLQIGGNGYTSAIALNDEGMQIYHNSSSRAIIFGINESEKVRIASNGNVGIGTETPSAKLSIMGGSVGSGAINALELKHYTTNSTGDGTAILFNGGYENNAWAFAKISATNWTGGYGADLQVHIHPADGTQSSSVVQALSIIGDGSSGAKIRIPNAIVGIGTDNPSKTLTLYGASSSSFRISKSGVVAYDHTFDGSTYTIANNNGSAGIPLVIGTKTAGAESLRITAAGKVGINTSDPGRQFEISGGASSIYNFSINGGNSTTGMKMGNYTAASGYNKLSVEASDILFYTGAAGGTSSTQKVSITTDNIPTLLIGQTTANADANGWTLRGDINTSSCKFTSTDVRTMMDYSSYHSTGSQQSKVSIHTTGMINSRYGTSLVLYSCERRTKKNIVDLDKTKAWNTLRDTPMYSWNYKKEIEGSKKHYGPIVDECPEDIIIPGIEEDEEGIINTVDSDKLQYRAYTALSEALKRIEALEAEVAALKSS